MRCPIMMLVGGVGLLLSCGPGLTARASVVTGEGGGDVVKRFPAVGVGADLTFPAYSGFTGGVRVATGDVSGDGVPDIITGPGSGAGSHVRVFDGISGGAIDDFFAYAPSFSGGVYVAAGDVDGDGRADLVTGAGASGGPHVKVFDAVTGGERHNFFAYTPTFTGGVRVAAGDVNGDGLADIITAPGAGAGPHVKVFDGDTGAEMTSFFAFDAAFTGGVFVAAGDVNGDGHADLVTGADAGGAPHVKVFDGLTQDVLHDFLAFDPSFAGGVRVAAGDLNGDGRADIITGAGSGGGPHVRIFDGLNGNVLNDFFAYDPDSTGGVYVAAIPEPGSALVLALAALGLPRRRARRRAGNG